MGDNPTTQKGPGSVEWERVEKLNDKRKVGQYGGLWYLLDENEEAISDGYHRIVEKGNGFGYSYESYRGYLGDKTTVIEPHSGTINRS